MNVTYQNKSVTHKKHKISILSLLILLGTVPSAWATNITASGIDTPKATVDKVIIKKSDINIDKNGINAGDKQIAHVASGASGVDAANKPIYDNDTNGANIGDIKNLANGIISNIGDQIISQDKIINNISQSVNKLDSHINHVAAGAAALAALHPLEFDSSSKLTLAAGFGAYKNEQSAALGAFYRPNRDVMVSLSTAVGNADNMYNAGLSIRFGQSSPYEDLSKTMLISELEKQNKNMAELVAKVNELEMVKAENAELNTRLSKLEALLATK